MSADDAILPDAALDQHIAIIGRTGSGKTYTAKGFAERLLDAGRHVVIVDPTGVWWGLRSSANGQSPGFPVIVFGGRHADVPMAPGSGSVLGELIVQRRISCVIDVSEFTISARTPFLASLLEAFYSKCRSPLQLVLDEADIMAPQRPMPDQTLLLNRTEQIVRRGRARGLRTMLITQRPAVLHKDVLSQAGTLIAMKLTAPQDRNALGAWIDGQADREKGKAVLASLPRLLPGVGWVWWPEGDVLRETVFPRISTFDSSSTPEHGTVLEAPILAPVDIEDIRALLGAPEPKLPKGAAASIEKTLAFERARSTGVAEGRAESAVELAALRARVQQLNEAIDAVAKVLLAAQRNDHSASNNAAPALTAPAAADKPGVQGIAALQILGPELARAAAAERLVPRQ